jgi:hypothetical protein
MFGGLGMPLPYLSNKPGPGRPGWSAGTYDFQFEVTGAVTIKAQPAATGQSFTIKWPNGTEQTTTGSNSIPAPDDTAGIVSINKKTDTTYADEFAVVGGQTNVSKVLSWGSNPWTTLSSAFLNCTNLTDISTTSLITGSGCALSSAFKSCTSLTDVNISSWDMTNAAVIDEMFRLCTGLEVFQASSLHVNGGSRWWLRETGTAVTDGCEYRFNGLNITSTSFGAGNMTQWWYGMKINPASSFANISWPSIAHAGADFQNSSITGVNSTLDCSGWTNYNSGVFPKFSSFTATEGGTSNMKIDITNLNVSTVVSFNRSFMSSHISEIIGLGGLGATAGVSNAEYAFLSASYMKFTNHNFSSAFINSFNLGSSNFLSMFNSCGFSLAQADAGSPPNLHSLNLSSATSLVQSFYRSRFSTAPDFSNVTISPTTAYNLSGCFQNMALSDGSNVNSLFSKTFKVSNFTSTFSTTTLPSIIIGNGVDFSSCTTMTRMFQNATATDVQLPTNMDLGNMTGVNSFQYSFLSGPTLSTCQVDNFIRRLHATALTNGLAIDFNNAAVTESPSVVQSLESELTTNGWSITANSTDATLPFAYPSYIFDSNLVQSVTPTTVPTGGQFSTTSSGVNVNSSTGEVTWSAGIFAAPTIRCTYSDGCYNEVKMFIVDTVPNSYSTKFDGVVDSSFHFPNTTVALGEPWTISFWFKRDGVPSSRERFLYGGSVTGGWFTSAQEVNTNGQLLMRNVNGTFWYWTNTNVCDNQWHHIVLQRQPYTPANNYLVMRSYVDGVLDRTAEINDWRYKGTLYNEPLEYIGAGNPVVTSFTGHMDEFAVWNSTLTQEEIALIYQATSANKMANLSSLPTQPDVWFRLGD